MSHRAGAVLATPDDPLGDYDLLSLLANDFEGLQWLASARGGPCAGDLVLVEEPAVPEGLRLDRSRVAFEACFATDLAPEGVLGAEEVIFSGDRVWLVRAHREGLALTSMLRLARAWGRGVPLGVTLRVVLDALRALHALHGRRRLAASRRPSAHLRVTPRALHVGLDGVTRVLDDGLARSAARPHPSWPPARAPYAAPEVEAGGAVDRRADVYSVGSVLKELCARGRDGAGPPRLDARTSLRHLDPGLPRVLSVICACATAEDPGDRYATAEGFADELRRELGPLVATRHEVTTFVLQVAAGDLGLLGVELSAPARAAPRYESGIRPGPPRPADVEPPHEGADVEREPAAADEAQGSSPDLPALTSPGPGRYFEPYHEPLAFAEPSEMTTRPWRAPRRARDARWLRMVAALLAGFVIGTIIVLARR